MKLDMTVSEATEILKETLKQPEQLFEMIHTDIRETVGQYLTAMMNAPDEERAARVSARSGLIGLDVQTSTH